MLISCNASLLGFWSMAETERGKPRGKREGGNWLIFKFPRLHPAELETDISCTSPLILQKHLHRISETLVLGCAFTHSYLPVKIIQFNLAY